MPIRSDSRRAGPARLKPLPVLVALSLLASACGSDVGSPDEPPTAASDTGNAAVTDNAAAADTENDNGTATHNAGVVEPAATGPLTPFEMGGVTLEYDASYWRIDEFGDIADPQSALVWFVNDATNAVVQVSFDADRVLDPSLDPCVEGYTGGVDAARHDVTLLHESTLANGARVRIHREDLDTLGNEAVIGTSYAYVTFAKNDDRQVGDTFCSFNRWINQSPHVRDDGTPVLYSVQAYFTFSTDFVYAPFKERFDDDVNAMLARPGYAEMLALLQTIEVSGTPTPPG